MRLSRLFAIMPVAGLACALSMPLAARAQKAPDPAPEHVSDTTQAKEGHSALDIALGNHTNNDALLEHATVSHADAGSMCLRSIMPTSIALSHAAMSAMIDTHQPLFDATGVSTSGERGCSFSVVANVVQRNMIARSTFLTVTVHQAVFPKGNGHGYASNYVRTLVLPIEAEHSYGMLTDAQGHDLFPIRVF